jgi:D-aminopeptidase
LLVEPPFRWAVALANPSSAQRAALIPSVARVDARSVQWSSDDFAESFRTFQAVALIVLGSFEATFD